MRVLCSIPTRGRYDTTLPMALTAVIMQTRVPDKIIVFDDNDTPTDVRNIQHYAYLFQMCDLRGIQWEWIFAKKMGQHHSHQLAQQIAKDQGYEWIWRVDDDLVPEPNVLKTLLSYVDITPLDETFGNLVGAVGGSILTPPLEHTEHLKYATGKVENITKEPNLQWGYIKEMKSVDHLHCSFLYRAGVHEYNLNLSRVAHREETLFTYGLKQKGYDILVVPDAVSWHLKNKQGGIRSETNSAMYDHDDDIFKSLVYQKPKNATVVVLDCGLGDHIVFREVLKKIKNPIVFSCYPEIIPGGSISEARERLGNLDQYNIYMKMDQWGWKDSLEKAYCKLYNVE